MTNAEWLAANPHWRAGGPVQHLSAAEISELLPDESDPTLVGNRIAAAIERFGIPPCVGCGERRDWLNRAHLWLRSWANSDKPPADGV
jgi:hypothetical protein